MPLAIVSLTISAGQSLSPPVDLGAGELLRLYMPPQWDDAVMTFQMSPDNTTYADAFDPIGLEMAVNITPGAVILVGVIWRTLAWIKFRSGTRKDPIIQTADRTFRAVVLR